MILGGASIRVRQRPDDNVGRSHPDDAVALPACLLATGADMQALRTEGSENLAYVYGQGSWVSGRPTSVGRRVDVRFVVVWRKEDDGQWRVAHEMLNPPPTTA
jgi:hypothetical protein